MIFVGLIFNPSIGRLFMTLLNSSDAPIMIFRGRFRYRFFPSKLADSDSDLPIFFPLSNQQEIMKDSNTNKVVI